MRASSIFQAAPARKLYWGWLVVAAAFLVATFGFGVGFYGTGIYLLALKARHGWSTGVLSSAITMYYVFGAGLLFFVVGPCSIYGEHEWLSPSALSRWPAGWSR